MKHSSAIAALSALGDEHRLAVFRLLVRRGPEGFQAGEISARLDLAPSRLSFHLKVLSDAGLIAGRREGRFMIYTASFQRVNSLVAYLTENCCTLGSACDPGCGPEARVGKRRSA